MIRLKFKSPKNKVSSSTLEVFRKDQMQSLAFWVAGPIAIILILQSIITDFKLYPEVANSFWVMLRLGIIPISLSAMLLLKSKKLSADLIVGLVALYIAGIHSYFLTKTGYVSSKYFHSYIQILLGSAILPMKQRNFFLLVFCVLGIYVGTILGGGYHFSFLLSGDAMFLKTYILMSFLLFYSIRYARVATYKAKFELESELQNRQEEIDRLVAGQMLAKEAEYKMNVSRQVSHDIRSPLSALNLLLGSAGEITEEKRHILRLATKRINDIATDLLSSTKPEPTEAESVSEIIESLVLEKQIQFRDFPEVKLISHIKSDERIFAQIDSCDLKRVLSNLLNNSFEALKEHRGLIQVSAVSLGSHLQVILNDDGCGIPPRVFEKLGTPGFSFGKNKSGSGNGLGISHAKETLERCGGRFDLETQFGQGTQVTLTLPRAVAPNC